MMLCGGDGSAKSWLEETFGDDLIGQDGKSVSAKEIAEGSAMVSLYFSAHWCPPCRKFTPNLASVYKRIAAEKKWEVIFVSSDRDQEAFDEYFGEQPWKALKYANRDLKATLSGKFGVQGIPTLIHLDPKTGKVFTKDGRSSIIEDPEGKDFPWKAKTFWEVMDGVTLLKHNEDKSGEVEVSAASLKDSVDYIGIYFSAHWCPPCRNFTPKLNEWYKKNVTNGDTKVEFIFNTWDRDAGSHKSYWNEKMDFLTRKYDDKNVRSGLDKMFEVSGIPTLAIVDAKTGQLITKDARGKIDSDPEAKEFPWEKQPVGFMGGEVVDALNSSVCCMAHCEKEQGKAAMTSSAVPYMEAKKADGEWPGLMDIEFIVDDGKHDLSGRVTGLIKKTETEVLYILHLGSKTMSYLEDVTTADQITEENVKRLIAGYKAKTLKTRPLDL